MFSSTLIMVGLSMFFSSLNSANVLIRFTSMSVVVYLIIICFVLVTGGTAVGISG